MKQLKVIKNFNQMEVGDIYDFSAKDNSYVCEVTRDDSYLDARTGSNFTAKSSYKNTISQNYAMHLLKAGYLEEINPSTQKTTDSQYVNVFDEISRLREKYLTNLDNINDDYKDQPACMKVEAETVLSNMIKLLTHLSSLKK